MRRFVLRAYVEEGAYAATADWRGFTDEETARIQEMFGHCGCGGARSDEGHPPAQMRCPECRSTDVRSAVIEAFVD
jgi:hypothetical protein